MVVWLVLAVAAWGVGLGVSVWTLRDLERSSAAVEWWRWDLVVLSALLWWAAVGVGCVAMAAAS